MKKRIFISALAVLTIIFIQSCKKDSAAADCRKPALPQEVDKYDAIPAGPNGFNPTGSIMIDNEVATLGRVLFYETQLSINNRVSCGSCHHQGKAFADNAAFSQGFENARTKRNTPSIVNPGTQGSYFWDMRESNLSAMVTQPIANHIEMGLDQPDYIVAKVKNLPYYEPLFTAAFGDAQVNMDRIGVALANFVGAMVSVQSKYDMGASNGFANFNQQEEAGRLLFTNSLPCRNCHGGENFSGWGTSTQNIGLETDYVDNGQPGIDWNTGHEQDGWFKIPSLRNVALTGPYMHDGRFQTLEEVVEFYNSGIQAHDQLSFSLREGWDGGGIFQEGDGEIGGEVLNPNGVQPVRLNLTEDDKKALVAFLRTLSDDNLCYDSKFADPFTSAN